MKGTKAQEMKYWLEHVAFWDAYYRNQTDEDIRRDADETARKLGEIVRKIQGNL